MSKELELEVKEDIVEAVEEIYESTKPPEVLIRPLKPEIEISEEKTMEKQARFKVLSAQTLATVKAQVIADVVDLTEQTLEMAEEAVKELVTDPGQQHEILSYIEKKLAKNGIWAQFDKPQLEPKASEAEKKTVQSSKSLRDRIKDHVEGV